MTESKDGNQKTRIPYELPKLFDLGGGVAYAKGKGECKDGTLPAGLICKAGGSPGGGTECKQGVSAGADCRAGQFAGVKCDNGITASGGDCKDGSTAPSRNCDSGNAAKGCKKGGNTGKKK